MTAQDLPSGVRYAIGLDIGDGESSLGWAPLDRAEPARIYTRPGTGEQSIVTAMAWLADLSGDRLLIGDAAATSRGARHFSVNFKSAPDALSLGTPDSVRFAQALLAEFRAEHPEVFRHGMVFVGHPAGWSPESVAAYGRHLEVLGLPVRLMPESQSALLYVRDNGRTGRQLERVLVIDIGSSTTDCTFVEDLSPANLPVGAALGCRQIDEQLARTVSATMRHDRALMDALSADGGWDFLLLACRWAKEAQFSGASRRILNLRDACEGRFQPIVATAWTWLQDYEIPRAVAAPGGWGDRFRAVLGEVAALLGDRGPELIVLTGGGSRMPLTARLAREVFPATLIEHDTDPAFAVTRGLVSNGRHRATVSRFRRDVTRLLEAPETEQRVHAEAATAFAAMKTSIVADGRESADTLAGRINGAMRQAATDMAGELSAYLSVRLQEICRRYGVPDDRVRLDLSMPDLFSDRMDRVLDRVDRAGLVAENAGHFTAEAAKVGAKTWQWGAQLARTKFAPAVVAAGAVVAVGAVAAGSGWAADRAARVWIRRMIRLSELSDDDLSQLTAEVMSTITTQTNDRVRDVERLLA